MRVLVVNVGSSSVKLDLLEDEQVIAREDVPGNGGRLDEEALRRALVRQPRPDAVGHRIVHGGTSFTAPVEVDAEVRRRLDELVPLAPLHLPHALGALDAVCAQLPDVPAVACFDTAFHTTMPPQAATYALPASWRERWALRRFGFHGLSHSWATRRAGELAGRATEDLRIVSCHLGAGSSLAAVRGGHSVDTTMGFTPLDGLVMATRAGSIDPGVVLYLLEQGGLSTAEVRTGLEEHSGLAGLAGSPDMRTVLEQAEAGDERAGLAVAVFVHRLRAEIAAMVAALEGCDVLVFTGGIGEHAPVVRSAAVDGLAFLGLRLDPTLNAAARGDAEVSATTAPARTFVVTAREDLVIARAVTEVLGASPS